MSSPRPKSPRTPVLPKKEDKGESFWDKIGTIGRKKGIKEVQEVQAEGKYAIDSPGSPNAPEIPPEEYSLLDNEERAIIEPRSLEDPRVKELIQVLIDWINDELAMQRIIVKDISEDLYDGQVLQKLLEKLAEKKLDVPEVTQSEEGQRQKLAVVLKEVNKALYGSPKPVQKWSVDSVHSKNIVSILHLLVALARQFRAPVRLPENVRVNVVVVKKDAPNQLSHRTYIEDITTTYDDLGMKGERDAFDALFDHAPDKLQVVKKPKSQPLSKDEVMQLLNLVHANPVVFSKATNATNNQLKEAAWSNIADSFNALIATTPRRPEQLRLKWENLKKAARKRSSNRRLNRLKAGGGVPDYIPPDEALDKVESLLGSTYAGFSVEFEGDGAAIEPDTDEVADGAVVDYLHSQELPAIQPIVSISTPVSPPAPQATASKLFLPSAKSKVKKNMQKLTTEDIQARIKRNNAIAEYYALKKKKLELEILELQKRNFYD